MEIIGVIAITVSVFLARRLIDHRSISSLGLVPTRQALMDLIIGIVIAGTMMGLVFLLEWRLGWLSVAGFSWRTQNAASVVQNTLVFFAIFILVGWGEEVLSRGYHLQTIASGLTLPWGVMLSSTIFGLLHLTNPNASWIAAVGIVLAGFLLAYAFIRTHQLWLSIGLHIGWNFYEGVVFGFPVSGLTVYHLTQISVSGPQLWTGGNFGPEAGLIMIPAMAAGAYLINIYTKASPISSHRHPETNQRPSISHLS